MVRAMPRLANWASLLACTLVSRALVATTASVVLPARRGAADGAAHASRLRVSANSRLSGALARAGDDLAGGGIAHVAERVHRDQARPPARRRAGRR